MTNKQEQVTKLTLKLETGVGDKTVRRTFSHINPAVSDEDLFDLGNRLAALQSMTLRSMHRTDSAALVAAE